MRNRGFASGRVVLGALGVVAAAVAARATGTAVGGGRIPRIDTNGALGRAVAQITARRSAGLVLPKGVAAHLASAPTSTGHVLDDVIVGACVFVLAVLAVRAGLALDWRRLAHGALGDGEVDAVPEEVGLSLAAVHDAIGRSIDELGRIDDDRAAVIRAWLELEGAVARHLPARRASETSAELASRALTDASLDPVDVGELLACYTRARYSPAPVGPDDNARARACLGRLDAALAVVP